MIESVDLLIKAVDKAIQLLTVRSENRRRTFKDVVEPLYIDLQPVVEDYFSIFNRSIEEVKAAKKSELHVAIGNIKNLREQMLLARLKVQQLALAIKNSCDKNSKRDKQLLEFSTRILEIFYSTRLSTGKKASRSEQFVEFLDTIQIDDLSHYKSGLVDDIRKIKDEIAHAWLRVSQTYAGLLLESVR